MCLRIPAVRRSWEAGYVFEIRAYRQEKNVSKGHFFKIIFSDPVHDFFWRWGSKLKRNQLFSVSDGLKK